MAPAVGVLASLALLVVVALCIVRPVGRRRLTRFAARERVQLTVDSAPEVVRYLATTRRWRVSGLLVVVSVVVAWSAASGSSVTVDVVRGFCGWFLGALIAERRIAGPTADGPRTASLQRRRIADHVGAGVRVLVALVWMLVLLAGVVAAVAALDGHPARALRIAVFLLVGTALGAATALIARRVLRRPRPVVAPDRLAADDAMRRRSLHVLAGCAIAIGGYLGATIATTALTPTGLLGAVAINMFALLLSLVLPLVGVLIAVAPARRRASAEPVVVA